jgi:hypothetical protein
MKKKKILDIATQIDSRCKITFNSDGRIVLWQSKYLPKEGRWDYEHIPDIKGYWMGFLPSCDWFDFKSAIQCLADQINAFEYL